MMIFNRIVTGMLGGLLLIAGCTDARNRQPAANGNPSATVPSAPTAATNGKINLLAMGDWGNGGPKQQAVAAAMRKYVQSQQAAGRDYDAMVLAGDNFYVKKLDGPEDPQFKSIFEDMYDPKVLHFPFYASLGNHDHDAEKYKSELAYTREHPESRFKLPAQWYRVDLPKDGKPFVTLFMLDSSKPKMTPQEWTQQIQWLRGELDKPRQARWTVAVAHHPFFSNGDHGDNGELRNDWGELFKKNVDLYIAGHDHDLQHLEVPGWPTCFILVGGGGASTRPMRVDNRGPWSWSGHGFADVAFGDDAITVRFINRDAEIVHAFRRTRDGEVTILSSGPQDRATPRTVKSITRGGEEKPAPTTHRAWAGH